MGIWKLSSLRLLQSTIEHSCVRLCKDKHFHLWSCAAVSYDKCMFNFMITSNCLPKWLCDFVFILGAIECYSSTVSSPALDIISLYSFCHSSRYVEAHCGLNLHFSYDQWCWTFSLWYFPCIYLLWWWVYWSLLTMLVLIFINIIICCMSRNMSLYQYIFQEQFLSVYGLVFYCLSSFFWR